MSKNKQNPDAYKKLDLNKVVRQDLHAAIGMLSFVANNPSVFDALVAETEKIRTQIIEDEKKVVAEMDNKPVS